MILPTIDRREMARRLRDYFALQLRFAQAVADRTNTPLSQVVGQVTNLHRRFGFGSPGPQPCAAWRDYATQLDGLARPEERLAWTIETYVGAPGETLPAGETAFGCFSVERSGPGIARLHFRNTDGDDGIGPLDHRKIDRRRDELRRLFAHLRETAPDVRTVEGGSWLYNLEAYRRLFPGDYVASRRMPDAVGLTGTSSWGQFLDHRCGVKPALRDAFLENLERLDLSALWRAFPLPALRVSGSIALFDTHGSSSDAP